MKLQTSCFMGRIGRIETGEGWVKMIAEIGTMSRLERAVCRSFHLSKQDFPIQTRHCLGLVSPFGLAGPGLCCGFGLAALLCCKSSSLPLLEII